MIVKIGVSILSLDYEDISEVEQALMRADNANSVHLDVMDGRFVRNKTFDHELVRKIDTPLRKVVHLMVNQPEKVVDNYIKAGAQEIVFHIEATRAPKKLINELKEKGISVGIALNPETPLKKVKNYLSDIDMVFVMTVHPGKGGQKMLKTPLKKVRSIRKSHPALDIAVDGGINDKTAHTAIEAGANILVSGSYIVKSPDPKLAIDLLRNA